MKSQQAEETGGSVILTEIRKRIVSLVGVSENRRQMTSSKNWWKGNIVIAQSKQLQFKHHKGETLPTWVICIA
jgi:hypothetical protein